MTTATPCGSRTSSANAAPAHADTPKTAAAATRMSCSPSRARPAAPGQHTPRRRRLQPARGPPPPPPVRRPVRSKRSYRRGRPPMYRRRREARRPSNPSRPRGAGGVHVPVSRPVRARRGRRLSRRHRRLGSRRIDRPRRGGRMRRDRPPAALRTRNGRPDARFRDPRTIAGGLRRRQPRPEHGGAHSRQHGADVSETDSRRRINRAGGAAVSGERAARRKRGMRRLIHCNYGIFSALVWRRRQRPRCSARRCDAR